MSNAGQSKNMLLGYFNFIYAFKFFTWLQAVHPVLLTIVAGVAGSVASAVPRLDADERRVLGRR